MKKRKYTFDVELFREALGQLGAKAGYANQQRKAAILGISQSSYSRLENFQREPTLHELVLISNDTGYAPSDFFNLKKD